MKKQLFVLAALAMLACGCVREDFGGVPEGAIPLNIDGSINQVHTKATAQGFVDGDGLGLFAVNYINETATAGTLAAEGNQADNVKYVFDESNHAWTPVKPVYYKDVNTNVDLYVYYPYQHSISDINDSGFEVKQDQSAPASATELSGYEASDFLWGKAENITPTESRVAISLSHRLSAVEVTLVEGTGFAADEFASLEKNVIVTNTTRKATVDYATGVATPLGGAQLNGIVTCPQTSGSFRAIVIPQTVAASTQLFAITIDGISYKYSRAEATTYPAGQQSTFTITINKKSPSGDYQLVLTDTQIIPWVEDRNAHGGEARQYYVVNVETPGTLGQLIREAGKNPKKIKNLKVTGTVTNMDFYFMRDSMDILEAVNMKEAVLDCTDGDNYSYKSPYSYNGSNYDRYVELYGFPDVIIPYSNGGMNYAYWYPEEAKHKQIIPSEAFHYKSSLYYFEFPEYVERIGSNAFANSNISGTIIIPSNVEVIETSAFSGCSMVTGISLSQALKQIRNNAFASCLSLSGRLLLPNQLELIGSSAFHSCKFEGPLELPGSLREIGGYAFCGCSGLSGNLSLPDHITEIQSSTFSGCTGFNGHLNLNNVTKLGSDAFFQCKFSGELIIPDGIDIIPSTCFGDGLYSSIVFPSSLKQIESNAFQSCSRLSSINLPEGLVRIANSVFTSCNSVISISLPSTVISIGTYAFAGCNYVSSIVCNAIQVPSVLSYAFNGIPKDNFTLEVPAQSVSLYQAASGWGDFRRIAAHYDFSISRSMMRGLNAGKSRAYTLRCPSGFDWSIQSKPDWVTVSPDHGTGKTEVTVTFAPMPRTSGAMYDLDNVNKKIGTGRNGEVVFLLDEKNYTTTLGVEQYDSDYADGQPITLQTATKGTGIDIVFIGDGYDAKDIATGAFLNNVNTGYQAYFNIEPYTTYKDYFNVYAVVSESDDSGIGTVNTVKDTKFGSYFSQNRILAPNAADCFSWASKAKNTIDFSKSLVIMLQNASVYEGVCLMYGDGSAIACCPMSTEAYPYDFRGIIQHEAGGHGFGKLADEYIYHNAFIQTCNCIDGCDHPKDEQSGTFGFYKSKGWYKNLSMSSDPKLVPWSHLIFHPQYSDYVDMFEGGYMHSRGMYRSEATSCMNNNIPYYSAISRQAIVERIKEYAGETFTLEEFYAKDSRNFGTRSGKAHTKYMPDLIPSDGRQRTAPIYMGEHPKFKR